VLLAGGFDLLLLVPFVGWAVFYVAALRWFVPRLGRVGRYRGRAQSVLPRERLSHRGDGPRSIHAHRR